MNSTPRPANVATTSVACLNCRDKHLKCDGNLGGCARCRDLALFCHFVPSRRGRRGQPSGISCPDQIDLSFTDDNVIIDDIPMTIVASADPASDLEQGPQGEPQMNMHLIKAFFEYFHPSHPILPPLEVWALSSPPQYLVNIVEFIGLHHTSPGQVPECSNYLVATLENNDLSLEKLQGYLLLAILSHGRKGPEYPTKYIGLAIESSLKLGLHCRELSDTVELLKPARSESMRRTLWEILVVDTLLAAVQIEGTLKFEMEMPNVPLPGRDENFNDPFRISSISASDLLGRALFDDDPMPPLAYRVEAALLLRQCIVACQNDISEEPVEELDAKISAWFHRWPTDNSTILQRNGRTNEIDLQTAMLVHSASIYLHFRKSSLVPLLPNTGELFCATPPLFPAHSSKPQIHTAKIVSASVELSKLASLSTYVTGHSPFFACTLVLSSIIQIAVLGFPVGQSTRMHYSYLALNIGVLRTMGGIWEIAASSIRKLRALVREVKSASIEEDHGLVGSSLVLPFLQS